MKHDADESSFGICAQNIPSSDATPRGGNHESNTSGDASAPFATLDQTVSALKGDVPGGSLERLGERSLVSSLEVNDQLELGRLHDRQVGWLLALKNPAGVDAGEVISSCEARSI